MCEYIGQYQAIIGTHMGILLIGNLGTNFSEISIGIRTFSLKKMHSKYHLETCGHFNRPEYVTLSKV